MKRRQQYLNERDKQVQREYSSRFEQGETATEVYEDLAEKHHLDVNTIKKIIYDKNYRKHRR